MGAVADVVSDVVGDVFEAVGDVVESVADVVSDVVDTVGAVVQAVIDDPLPTLLSYAGTAVFGIPPMVTMGAITAARGGDLEDIALSVGTSYLGSSVGGSITNSISSTFSDAFIDAGVNETFSKIASDSITKGLINGTVAEVKGGDFIDGFAGGAVGGLVAGGVGEVADFFKPDIVNFAMENGLDLRDANAVYNAGVKAVSAGVNSELTGRNDFVTSFTTSVINSGVDYGVRSINQQFDVAATSWNSQDGDRDPIDLTVAGQGIPNNLVTQVQVSDIGVDATASTSTFDAANVLGDTFNSTTGAGNVSTADAENINSGASVPEEILTATQPQIGETEADFEDLISTIQATSDEDELRDANLNFSSDVANIAEGLPTEEEVQPDAIVEGIPTGALASVSEAPQTTDLLDVTKQDEKGLSETPIIEDLLSNTLAKDKTEEQPIGGLNAVSQTTPQDKTNSLMGFKATDIAKPLVVTAGNLLKQGLTQPKRTAVRPARPPAPVGGLKMASAKPRTPTPPPRVMDVSKLTRIQKAAPTKKSLPAGLPKTVAGTTKLSPVKNIEGLTSMVKKVG